MRQKDTKNVVETEEEEFEGFNNGYPGTWEYDFTEEKGYKKYILYENSGEVFRSQVDCRKKVSIPQPSLSACLTGRISHYKNMRFRYVYMREEGRTW